MAEEIVRYRPGNRVDDTILRHADTHSPEEISDLLGGMVSPARVAAHTQQLLKSRSWLTEAQEEQIVLWKLRKVLLDLEARHLDVDNAKLRLSYLKEISTRLDKRRSTNETDLTTYSTNVGREMARVYDIALSFMKGALRGDIDAERWDKLASEALVHAQSELMKKAIDD